MTHFAQSHGARIAYSVHGPSNAPALVLSSSIGTTRDLWEPQVPVLARTCRVITYDTRGHGESDAPAGDYSMEQLGRDVLAILDAEGIAAARVCGLSLGGLTTMWLGAHAPERVSGLVLANTAARVGSVTSWNERIALVRTSGMAAVADRAMTLWFSGAFHQRSPEVVARFRAMVSACNPDGYAGCCGALRDADLRPSLGAIGCPTLVIAGRQDLATTVSDAETIVAGIPHATIRVLDTAHLSNVENPEAFNDALLTIV